MPRLEKLGASISVAIWWSFALVVQHAVPQNPSEAVAVPGSLTVTVVSSDSDRPLDDAQVHFVGRIGVERLNQTQAADEAGTVQLEYAADKQIQHLWFTASAPGFTPAHYVWRSDRQEIKLPKELRVELDSAITIEGRVVNALGQPIASATVDLHMPITWPKLDSYVFSLGTVQTDVDGNWQFESAPADPSRVSISVSHPEYLKAGVRGATHPITTVMEQGLSIAGKVVDSQGQPIVAARVRFGDDRFGTDEPTAVTDEFGLFRLFNCDAKRSIVTVEAQGYAPQFLPVNVQAEQVGQHQDLVFRLQPGNVVRLKVVDARGMPIAGVIGVTDTWRGYRTLEFRSTTDSDGILQWNSAPPDAVHFDFLKSGYMAQRRLPISASPELQLVTLHPQLEISGRVLDAETKQPIKNFRIIRGQNQTNLESTYWRRSEAETFSNGRFSYRIDEPMLGWLLEISADGYQPVRSRVFQSDEGQATFNVLLQPADGPTGRVVNPQGQSVEGAIVVLASENKRLHMHQGWVDLNDSSADHTTSDAAGHFTFVPQDDEDFLVLAFHESGFGEVTKSQIEENSDLVIQPWGRIEGQVRIGSQPDADREVSFQPQRPDDGRSYRAIWSYGYETNTDAEGRFRFDRVLPGPGTLSRVIVVKDGSYVTHAPSGRVPIDVTSNETTHADLGGNGRQVRGKFVLDRQPTAERDGGTIEWRFDATVTLQLFDKQTQRRDPDYIRYVGQVNEAGDFTVHDVPDGYYRIDMTVDAIGTDGNRSGTIGRTTRFVTIEDTAEESETQDQAASQDLGELVVELFDTLDPGEWAPNFVAETFDGQFLRLTDLQGKLVVVNFWSTRDASSVAENATWATNWNERLATDSRLAVVSISVEERKEAAAEALKNYVWPWRQVYAGPRYSKIPTDYTVRALPANFIISPTGRVLRKNVPASKMLSLLAELLEDDQLFAIQETAPPRFRLLRTQPANEEPSDFGRPAIVVLNDSDPSFDSDDPHTDDLIAYDTLGQELWRKSQFNVSLGMGKQSLATDAKRGLIYVCENVARRLTAVHESGQLIWKIDDIDADCVMVDPLTGNLWCSGGGNLQHGETVVLSPSGEELAAWPFRAICMAYDPATDGFWLAGYQLIKISRDGKIVFRQPVAGWCISAISVYPRDGSIWIGERQHSDISASRNRLWLRSADGRVLQELNVEEFRPMTVACLPNNGAALFSGFQSALRFVTRSGEITQIQEFDSKYLTLSQDSQRIWAVTDTGLVGMGPEGIEVKISLSDDERVTATAAVFE